MATRKADRSKVPAATPAAPLVGDGTQGRLLVYVGADMKQRLQQDAIARSQELGEVVSVGRLVRDILRAWYFGPSPHSTRGRKLTSSGTEEPLPDEPFTDALDEGPVAAPALGRTAPARWPLAA